MAAADPALELGSRFRALFDANIIGVLEADEERIVEANEAFLAMVGYTREDLDAGLVNWGEMTPPEYADADAAAMEHLLGPQGLAGPWEKEYVRKDGSRVPILIGCATLSREPFRALCYVLDLTERRRSLDRVTRLHGLASALNAALSAEQVAQAIITHGMAATGASGGVLGLVSRDELVLVHHHRFGGAADAPRRLGLDAPAPMPTAVRTGAPVLLASRAAWLEHFPVPPRGEFEAFAAVPLVGDGGAVGCMGLGFAEMRAFEPADIELLQVVASQGAQALARAALYEDRVHVARTLQRGLLPTHLPHVPGLEIAAAYQPLGAGDEVGGDFYDVFATDTGWTAAIGDVCGKGVEAAVVTGMVRHTLRALELAHDDPVAVLGKLDRALLAGTPAERFLSIALVHLSAVEGGGFEARLASAGHCPPLLLSGGRAEEVRAPGGLLGLGEDIPAGEVRRDLARGDALVLYTDGIVEARRDGELFGEERLRAAVEGCAGATPAEIAACVQEAVAAFAPGEPADDQALLVLRVEP